MSRSELIGLAGIGVLLLLMVLRVPIGIAMLLVGIVGFAILNGLPAASAALATYPYAYAAAYDFAVISLFVLMGNLGSAAGMGRESFMLRPMPGSAIGAAGLRTRPFWPARASQRCQAPASRRR